MKNFTTKNSRFDKIGKSVFVCLFWLIAWQCACMAVDTPLLLPSPASVAKSLFNLIFTAVFWKSVFLSIARIMGGFALATATGVILGTLTALSPFLSAVLSPAVKIIRATPVASFIILLLVWLKTNSVPLVTSFLMVLPVVWANIAQGIVSTDKNLLEMAKVYRFSKWTCATRIYIPSILPFFMAASITGVGLAWKAGVAAEVLCLPKFSIGRRLNDAKLYLETPDLFAWTMAVILLSMAIEFIFVKTMNSLLPKLELIDKEAQP